MDEEVRDVWNKLISGDPSGVAIEGMQRRLLYVCVDKAKSTDPEERLEVLRVVSHFTVDDRMRMVDPMIRDRDERVRRYAFNLAVEAGADGITPLKTCIDGKDFDLATEALELLITQCDTSSSLSARGWLESEDPRIRGGAAILLGNISGPAVGVQLRRLSQTDPNHGVRVLAEEAARRCSGELPKATSRDFWEAGPTKIVLASEPVAEPVPTAAPVPPSPRAVVPPPPLTLSPAPEAPVKTAPVASPVPPPPAIPAPPTALPVPAAPQGAEEVRQTARDWRDPAPLPSALPSEASALLKLMGMVGEGDREKIRNTFRGLLDADQRTALTRWRSGDDLFLGRGTALMIGALDDKARASSLRPMLTDGEAAIRAAAAEASGQVGALSTVPPLSQLLNDGVPEVKAAAVRGLGVLLKRLGRRDMLEERVGPLSKDPNAVVQLAVADALTPA